MCNYVAAELLVSFPDTDRVAAELMEEIEHPPSPPTPFSLSARLGLRFGGELGRAVGALDLPMRPLTFRFYRLLLRPDEEFWAITQLQAAYRNRALEAQSQGKLTPVDVSRMMQPENAFNVQLNHILHPVHATPSQPGQVPAPAISISEIDTSGSQHASYLQSLGVPVSPMPALASSVNILIIDSGIAADVSFPVTTKRNIFDPQQSTNVDDQFGHGSAIAVLIHDVIPDAKISVFKVYEQAKDGVSEWNALAALAASADMHVINFSIAYGLNLANCPTCGTSSHEARSVVFETMINQLSQGTVRPVLVAAVGNGKDDQGNSMGKDMLAFPARYGDVIAIGSVDSQFNLSEFSNYGLNDHKGNVHERHYVLPGGQTGASPEDSGQFVSTGDTIAGTSYATAYASGVIATLIAQNGLHTLQDGSIYDIIRNSKDANISGYSEEKHGKGFLTMTP